LLAGNDLIIQPVGRAGKIVVENYAPGLFGLDLPEFGEEGGGGGGGGSGNHAPVVQEPVTDLTGTQNQPLTHILPETLFTDPDGNPLTYTLTLADDAALPDWLAFDPETRTLSGTPGNEEVGSLDLKITATDPGNLSASQTFVLTVQNVNDAPVASGSIPAQSAKEGETFSLTLPESLFVDPDGDALSFAVTLADGSALPAWLTFDAATKILSGTPGAGEIGDLSLKVTASDGSLSASQTFVLTVQNVNDAPVASGSIPAQSGKEGEAFSLTLPESLFVDPDGDALSFAVTLADGSALPAWLTFDAATKTLSGTPGAGEIGDLSLKVTATDQDGASASIDFALGITSQPADNQSPEAVGSIPAQSAKEGETFFLTLPESLFVDPDGDALSFAVTLADGSALPAWLSFDAATKTLSGTPGAGEIGDLSLKVTASDGSLSAGLKSRMRIWTSLFLMTSSVLPSRR
jgi:hypothetical protein